MITKPDQRVDNEPESFGINDAIVDWRTIRGARTPFHALASLDDLLCLFSLTESIALYDHLWVAPEDLDYLDVFQPFIDDRVFVSSVIIPDKLNDPTIQNNFDLVVRPLLQHGEKSRLTEVSFTASESTFARYLYAEAFNLDTVLDPILTSYVPLLEAEQRRSQIYRLYDKVSALFQNEINELIAVRAPIPLYIPPIPAVIMDRSGGKQNKILEELQIIRSEFEPFRKKYRKYQEILNNPDRYKLSELVEAKREGLYEVEVALDAIAKERSGGRLMMELYDAVISASLSGSDTGIKLQFSSPLDKLVGFAIKEIGIQIVRGRARCLFDLWKAAMQIRGYDSLIHRYFDLESSALSSDLDLIQTLSKWVDTKTGIERPV